MNIEVGNSLNKEEWLLNGEFVCEIAKEDRLMIIDFTYYYLPAT